MYYSSSGIACFFGSRSDCQYISDSYQYSGTDTYFCAESIVYFCGDYYFRTLDAEQYGRIYDWFMVRLFYLHKVKIYDKLLALIFSKYSVFLVNNIIGD